MWFKKKNDSLSHEAKVDAVTQLLINAIEQQSRRTGHMPVEAVAPSVLNAATPERLHMLKRQYEFEMETKGGATSRFQDAWRYILDSSDWSRNNYTFENFISEAFQGNVAAHRCIHLISQCVSSLDWYLVDANNERLPESHPAMKLFYQPNALQCWNELIYELHAYKETIGNSYLRAVKYRGQNTISGTRTNLPLEFDVIPGHKVEIKENAVTLAPERFIWRISDSPGKVINFEVDVSGRSDILHLKYPALSEGPYGLAPTAVALQSVLLQNTGAEWNVSLIKNGARPSGAIVVNQSLSVEQRDQLREEIDRVLSGPATAGRPLLLSKGMDYREMQMSPKDIDYNRGQIQTTITIGNAYGVPAQMLGIQESATYNNMAEAKLDLYEQTVLPEANILSQSLTNFFSSQFNEEINVVFDVDNIPALEPRRRSFWDKIEQSTVLTMNEKRQMLGFEPVAGGDEVYIESSKIPVGFDLDTEAPVRDTDRDLGKDANTEVETKSEDGVDTE